MRAHRPRLRRAARQAWAIWRAIDRRPVATACWRRRSIPSQTPWRCRRTLRVRSEKAETTRRPCLLAWASALRMKWTRQRCQDAPSTLTTAFFSPSWASEMTSLTPRRPQRASVRRNWLQKVSASEGQMSRPRASRRPSPLTPMAITSGLLNAAHLAALAAVVESGPEPAVLGVVRIPTRRAVFSGMSGS